MRSNIKITLIEPHEMVCNLLIPKTLIVAPRQSGKTESIKKAIKEMDYYKVFVHNKKIIDIKFTGYKDIHPFKDFFTTDLESIAYKIFVDDIEFVDSFRVEDKTSEHSITIDSPGIYAATTSKLDFDKIQHLIQIRRFDFERICIVSDL